MENLKRVQARQAAQRAKQMREGGAEVGEVNGQGAQRNDSL